MVFWFGNYLGTWTLLFLPSILSTGLFPLCQVRIHSPKSFTVLAEGLTDIPPFLRRRETAIILISDITPAKTEGTPVLAC